MTLAVSRFEVDWVGRVLRRMRPLTLFPPLPRRTSCRLVTVTVLNRGNEDQKWIEISKIFILETNKISLMEIHEELSFTMISDKINIKKNMSVQMTKP